MIYFGASSYPEQLKPSEVGRFKDNSNVLGYQHDGECMAEQPHCYEDTCRERFQTRLRKKFGSFDELNWRWSTPVSAGKFELKPFGGAISKRA